jgi:hypothetical protein
VDQKPEQKLRRGHKERSLREEIVGLSLSEIVTGIKSDFTEQTQAVSPVIYKTASYTLEHPEPFFREPLPFASTLLNTLTQCLYFDGTISKEYVGILARYPFIFSTLMLSAADVLGDPAATEEFSLVYFVNIGGPTGMGNDVAGWALFSSENVSAPVESVCFKTMSSVIAPGFNKESLDVVKMQEKRSMEALVGALDPKSQEESMMAVFLRNLATCKNIELKVLYGFASEPINSLASVIAATSELRKEH